MTITISGFALLVLILAMTAPEALLFPFFAVWFVWDMATSIVAAIWDLAVSVLKAIFYGGGANGGGEK